MIKIELFDPAMCCSTGVCGPSIDPELTRIAAVVHNLKAKEYDICRYNLANEPDAFADNKIISQLLTEKGPDVLPVTLINGEVKKEKGYLTNDELKTLTGIATKELISKPRIRL